MCHYFVILMKVKVKSLSRLRLFVTPLTVAYQAPPSIGFSRQEYWSGLPLPSPGNLPHPGIEPGSPALQADALPSEPSRKPGRIYSSKSYYKQNCLLQFFQTIYSRCIETQWIFVY